MDWVTLLTEKTILLPVFLILFSMAAIYISWRSDSLYPINMRLLRFFISKNDIEDPAIRRYLSDQVALITFRVTFGIKALTLSDAKKVANFAQNRNISMNLIGKADKVFNLGTCSINKKELPNKASFILLALFLLISISLTILVSKIALKNDLVVTIKETGTLVYLSQNEAATVNPLREKQAVKISNCNAKEIIAEKTLNKRDHEILCEILAKPSLKDSFEQEINEQKKACIIIIIALIIFSMPMVITLRNWVAALELNKLIGNDK
ncbi:MAG TPA: DUF6216 family protein [Xylella sp.]